MAESSLKKKKINKIKKSGLTTNIFILVNLEPIFGFILEINSIPDYLHGHTVAAMCLNMGHLVKKGWVKMRRNLKFNFWLDLKRAIFCNFFHKSLNYSKITILPVKSQIMKKIALGLSIFSKLFPLGVSEFCHQINFDGTEVYARPDTLS